MSSRPLALGLTLLLVSGGLAGGRSPTSAAEREVAPAPAGGLLQGRVSDASGTGIASVEVVIAELGRMTWTAADGSYRIADLAAGRYTVVLRRLGYQPARRELEVTGSTTLDLTLVISPFTLEPLIVTAMPSPVAPEQSPLPSASLSGDALRRNQTVSLAHAIEALPGVRTLGTGAQVGKPVIRGLTGPRVLVLDDSHRLEDYSWSDEDGPSVDARLVDRVEVIRGPASVLYGSDALGGVVNAVPRPLPEAPLGGALVRGGLEVYGASNNREFGSALRLEGARHGLGWRVYGVGRGSGDLRTPDGKLSNTGFLALNGEGAVGVRSQDGDLTLRYARYGGEFKLLEAEGPPGGAVEAGGPERKLADDRVQLGASYRVSGLRLEARAQWQRHSLIEVADAPGSAPGSGKESEQFNLLLNTGTMDLRAHRDREHLQSTLGVSGLSQANDSRGPIPLVPDAHVASGAVYTYERLRLGRWSLLAGARGDFHHIDADGNSLLRLADQSRNDAQFSFDAGVVFAALAPLDLSFNVGQAWRAPTLFELYSNGPHLGELRYEIGKHDLAPERGVNVDASVRWHSPRLVAEVAGFRAAMRNYVFIAPTDEFRDSLRVYRHEQADAVLAGTEVGLHVEARHGLVLQGRFDYVYGQNQGIDSPLPLVPPARGSVGAEMHWEDLGWASRVSLGAKLEMVAQQGRRSAFDVPTSSYALVDLEAGLARGWLGRATQIDLEVHNLADVRYRDYLSRYKEFALNPGRNVLVRLSTGI